MITKTLNLRELRERSGLRREQVAAAIGKSHTTVSNWETGRFEPTLTPAETKLALKIYKCSLDEFVRATFESRKEWNRKQGADRV